MTPSGAPARRAVTGAPPTRYSSARLRLALSYALFLVAAGGVVLAATYVVLHQMPNYPLTPSNPRDRLPAPSRQEILETLLAVSAFVLAGLAVVGVFGGWVLAGWVLRPLRQINEAARIAAAGDLSHRIDLTGRNDEFRQVADSFDAMLERLQESFEVRERFAANASHELRTPLTVTATLLDVAARDPETRTDPELLEKLTRTNDRAVALVAALLRLTDSDRLTHFTRVDLAAVARAAVAEQAEHAAHAGITVETRLAPVVTVADVALLGQLATNLVDNAIRHNDADGRVRVSTTIREDRATLTIENTGAVIGAEQAQRLREPFLRGVGRLAGGARAGHGLGLSIVDRIASSHGGELDIAPRAGGGLVVTVTLRAAVPGGPAPR
ncbi:HAMP domain-containing sensor histidine kinase [Georgenia halophila]|uniref:histidine kinase n=1 Tax=Georgenia halophila TaxID=620889 RepID=A0ABP8LNN9_9MICO